MSVNAAAQSLIGNDDFTFSIRLAGGQYLRKHLSARRFEQLRNHTYLNHPQAASLRVEVTSKENHATQVWDIWMSKYFGGK